MSDNTGIEWTDATWNPVTGCTKVSPGCDHCYAETLHERFHGPGSFATVTLNHARLEVPLRWRRPRRVFVNSMSDLFHDSVPDEYIGQVFGVMASRKAEQHTFQILTKRHARMRSWVNRYQRDPLPNVWLGVSVEDQKWADIRIPALLGTPAAVRFISAEPLLGPVDLNAGEYLRCGNDVFGHECHGCTLDWVIVGGESGRGARPMQPEWPRQIRDQCVTAGVPFLFKQWGEYGQMGWKVDPTHSGPMMRMGKKNAGRELDGRTWDEYPGAAA